MDETYSSTMNCEKEDGDLKWEPTLQTTGNCDGDSKDVDALLDEQTPSTSGVVDNGDAEKSSPECFQVPKEEDKDSCYSISNIINSNEHVSEKKPKLEHDKPKSVKKAKSIHRVIQRSRRARKEIKHDFIKSLRSSIKNQIDFSSKEKVHNVKRRKKRGDRVGEEGSEPVCDNKRKRENEPKEEYEFGEPYVLLTQQNGTPITCYMLPQQGSDFNKFIATSAQTCIPPQITTPVAASAPVQKSQNQAILITPKGVAKTLTKVPSPFVSNSMPVVHSTNPVQAKWSDAETVKLRETQKRLVEHLRSVEERLTDSNNKLNQERKNGYLVKVLQEKLINKRRQIKTMCTQKKRLTKRLDGCREELEKTRKALEMVETQAVLWNNLNMSDLGKLIFSLHTAKNKKSLDSRAAASRAPPEVKGFVISLYMTSPKAYQLVRDCFNGLPHPKTVAKWLHGERVDDTETLQKSQINEITLEETFSRVIEGDNGEQLPDQNQILPPINDELLQGGEMECSASVDETGTIYYVLDEKGMVTGQLTDPPPDIVFSSEGFEITEVSQHEVVITE